MNRQWLLLLIVLLAPGNSRADSPTVVGVVVEEKTGERKGGIPVGLYCSKVKDCKLGVIRPTNTFGVYALTKRDIFIKDLYILYEGPSTYTAKFVRVSVDCPQGDPGPCILFADDLKLKPRPPADDTKAQAVWLRDFADTQRVKALAGAMDIEEANKKVATEAAKIVGLTVGMKTTDVVKESSDKVLLDVYQQLKKLPPHSDLPSLPLLERSEDFLKLKSHPEFNRFKALPKSSSFWDTDSTKELSQDQIDVLLALPNKDIQPNWVNDSMHINFVRSQLGTLAPAEKAFHFGVMDKWNNRPPKTETVEGVSDATVRTLLKNNPDVRAWAFYQTLMKERPLTPQQRAVLSDRSRGLVPFVVEKGK